MTSFGFQLRNDGRAGPEPVVQSPSGIRVTKRHAEEATRQRRLRLCRSGIMGAGEASIVVGGAVAGRRPGGARCRSTYL